MKKMTFNITVTDNGNRDKPIQQEVKGFHAFDMFGFTFVVHKSYIYDKSWDVSELSTGLRVTNSQVKETAKKAIAEAIGTVTSIGMEKISEIVYMQRNRLIDAGTIKVSSLLHKSDTN
jgi:hypothetical protein